MIAQAIFSLLLCGVLLYAWAEYRRSPAVASMSVVVSLETGFKNNPVSRRAISNAILESPTPKS